MFDKRKVEGSKYLKPEFYKDSGANDFMLTFQPKSAPVSQFPPPKPNNPIQDLRKDRQIMQKAYFTEFTRKNNNQKVLPPIAGITSLSSRKFEALSVLNLNKVHDTGRLCLRSDSKPTRSKKPEVIDAMNASSLAVGIVDEDFRQDSLSSYRKCIDLKDKPRLNPKRELGGKEGEDAAQVKTPTFNGSGEDKIDYLKDLHKRIENGYSGKDKSFTVSEHIKTSRYSKGSLVQLKEVKSNRIENSEGKSWDYFKEPSSASKHSAIGSSISTDFPVMSPSNKNDQEFYRNYISQNIINPNSIFTAIKESPLKHRRNHPQIKVRNSGFPKDVFTLKHK